MERAVRQTLIMEVRNNIFWTSRLFSKSIKREIKLMTSSASLPILQKAFFHIIAYPMPPVKGANPMNFMGFMNSICFLSTPRIPPYK